MAGSFAMFCGILSARKKKTKPKFTAIITGTVFRGVGVSFPGVGITVTNKSGSRKVRRGVTGGRGEFSVHVPAGEAVYRVAAKVRGFSALEKEVEIYGMERVTVNFRMIASKQSTK